MNENSKMVATNFIKKIFRVRHALKLLLGRIATVDRGKLPGRLKCRVVQEKETFDIEQSMTANANDPIRYKTTVQFPEVCVYRIPRGRLLNLRAIPATKSRRIITEQTGGTAPTMLSTMETLKPFAILRDSLSKPEKWDGEYFSINSQYAYNYYHWVTDCVVSLRSYEKLGGAVRLIVTGDRATWQTRYLEILGYKADSFESYKSNHIQVDALYLSSWHKPEGHWLPPSPSAIAWLRERILSNITPSGRYQNVDKVYISRFDSNKMRVSNDREISKVFEQLGFLVVSLSELTVDDQVDLFSRASIFAGIHGAGFTNLIFSHQPKVVEFFPHNQPLEYFSTLTSLLRGEHFSYFSEIDKSVKLSNLESRLKKQGLN